MKRTNLSAMLSIGHRDTKSKQYSKTINFVCEVLAKKKVADLEKIATAVYIYLNFPFLPSDTDKAKKLAELKPHIPLSDAVKAIEEAKVFTQGGPPESEGLDA